MIVFCGDLLKVNKIHLLTKLLLQKKKGGQEKYRLGSKMGGVKSISKKI